MKNKISVAIATYNGERFLREQLDSLYNQTLLPDEIYVVDDSSTDGTHYILEEYRQQYGLKYEINEKKLGVNKNFEKAIKSCMGDYVCICDQDDIWFPSKIETLYKKIIEIEDDKPAVVTSQCIDVDVEGKVLPYFKPNFTKDTYLCKDTLLKPSINTQGCTMIINRKLLHILKSFPDNICMYDCYIGFVAASVGIKYNLAVPLMKYRHHDKNVIGKISAVLPRRSKMNLQNVEKWRENVLIPKERFRTLRLIYNEYGHLFSSETNLLYKSVDSFDKASTFRKLYALAMMKELSIYDRLFKIAKLVIGVTFS